MTLSRPRRSPRIGWCIPAGVCVCVGVGYHSYILERNIVCVFVYCACVWSLFRLMKGCSCTWRTRTSMTLSRLPPEPPLRVVHPSRCVCVLCGLSVVLRVCVRERERACVFCGVSSEN